MGEADIESPATGTEWSIEDLRRATTQALGLQQWDLSDDTNLLEHGLDSLRMMRLAGALRAGGYDIPLPDLAEQPTVAAWFAIVQGIGGSNHDLD